MVALPQHADPTIAAMERAIEARDNAAPARPYLGMSAIGGPCERALWYSFRWAARPTFNAAALMRFEDGHRTEDLIADRLRLVPGVTLATHDETGKQYGFVDFDEHFKGHMDGAIHGLLQAPQTWHVWECKACADKKIEKLETLKANGEKSALAAWDPVYYAQAVLYMHYSGMTRHYLTAASPGGRRLVSIRTNADEPEALRLKAKAERIITARQPLAKLSADPSWYQCRWCDFAAVCHGGTEIAKNCRTCQHSDASCYGMWSCALRNELRSVDDQRSGCELWVSVLQTRTPWRP